MANPTIKFKRSSVQGKVPTTAQLPLGEIAINTYDGKVFLKKDDGTESIVEVGGGGGGTPGGSDGQIQYNNGGSFGGASSFYYDDTNNRIGIGESTPISSLDINVGTGTFAFNVTGSEGQLFSVRNNLSSGSIFSINDISGIPLIDVDAGGIVVLSPSNSTDYVGIGLTNPTQKLDINGSARFRGSIYDNNNVVGLANSILVSTGSGFEWSNIGTIPFSSLDINVGTGTIALNVTGSEGQLFSVRNNLSSGSIFSVNDISGIPFIDVDASGLVQLSTPSSTDYVGIGLTNPTQKLDVNGSARFRGAIYDNNNVVGLANSLLVSTGSGFEWSNIETIPLSRLDINVGTGTIAFNVTGSEGQLFSVRNNLSSGSIFSVNDISGIPLIDVDSDGSVQLVPFGVSDYVGIGLTNPTQKLDVDGGVRLRGSVYDNNNSVGSSGQVLSSTGSGVEWVAQSGGGGGAELDITACLFT